jgi:molybdopterin/thiamine biosynthesis adenylyltransferase
MKEAGVMDLYQEKFGRNPFTKAQQKRIKEATFSIVGLGGTGGFIFENLLRAGAERFVLYDHDRFELSNYNRQLFCSDRTLDKPKVGAAIEHAKAVNSRVRIKAFGRFEPGTDASKADILMDGADNLPTKLFMARAARKARIPYVFCAAGAVRGIVTVFRGYSFEKAFQIPADEAELGRYTVCASVLCPAASLAASLASSQALNVVIGKPHVSAPEAIFFDLFRKDLFWRSELG